MDERLFSALLLNSEEKKRSALAFSKKRYVFGKVKNVPKGYFAGVCGLRGIGKTVLLLQLANEFKDSLYLSADASYLRGESLYGVVRFAVAKGFKTVFIDEVHCKAEWQQDLKTLYDEGEARVFFSGSAALEIRKGADLSRRALVFHLQPLSFREWLSVKKGFDARQPVTPAELFDAGKRKALVVETSKYAGFLREYFGVGGLLYPSDDVSYYYKALENTLEKIIHNDLEHLRAVDSTIEDVVYKVLEWIAASPVGEVNYSTLSSKVSVSKPTLIKVVGDLAKIGLVKRVLPCGKSSVRKEPKLFLAFPFREFLNSLFLKKSDVGSLREEFFVNHAGKTCYLKGKRGEKTPDFLFEGKTLEIGGAGKDFSQNPDFILNEGVSLEEKTIPLYLAGFLY